MPRATLLLLFALGSCASHQYFRPHEAAIVQSPAGYPAARYELEAEDKRAGRINVWSRGAWREDRDNETWTIIHLGLEITNLSAETLSVDLDEIQLRSIVSEGGQIEILEHSVHQGSPSIQPEQVGHIEFEFLVDREVSPTSIHSFAARWVVRDETEGEYRNLTVFQAGGYYGYGFRP